MKMAVRMKAACSVAEQVSGGILPPHTLADVSTPFNCESQSSILTNLTAERMIKKQF